MSCGKSHCRSHILGPESRKMCDAKYLLHLTVGIITAGAAVHHAHFLHAGPGSARETNRTINTSESRPIFGGGDNQNLKIT